MRYISTMNSVKKLLLIPLLCGLALIPSQAEEKEPLTPAEALPAGTYQVITAQQIGDADKPMMLSVSDWKVVNENGDVFLEMGGEKIPFQFTEDRSSFLIVLRFSGETSLSVFSGRNNARSRFVRRTDAATQPSKEFSPFEGKFWTFHGESWDPRVGSFKLEKKKD